MRPLRLIRMWKWIAVSVGIGLVAFLIFSTGLAMGRGRAPVVPAEQTEQPVAAPVATPESVPGCEPPGAPWCQWAAVQPAVVQPEKFEWNEPPKLPGLFAPQPTPVPPGFEKVKGIPIVGDVAVAGGRIYALLRMIVVALRWIIQNILGVGIFLVVVDLLLKLPAFAIYILGWEMLESIWEKDKSVGDAWNHFKQKKNKGGLI